MRLALSRRRDTATSSARLLATAAAATLAFGVVAAAAAAESSNLPARPRKLEDHAAADGARVAPYLTDVDAEIEPITAMAYAQGSVPKPKPIKDVKTPNKTSPSSSSSSKATNTSSQTTGGAAKALKPAATGMKEVQAGIFHLNVPAAAAEAAEEAKSAASAAAAVRPQTPAKATPTADVKSHAHAGRVDATESTADGAGAADGDDDAASKTKHKGSFDMWPGRGGGVWRPWATSAASQGDGRATSTPAPGETPDGVSTVTKTATVTAVRPVGVGFLAAGADGEAQAADDGTDGGLQSKLGQHLTAAQGNSSDPTPPGSPTSSTSSGAAASPTQTSAPLAEVAERNSSLALFLVLSLLIFSFWTSYYLKVKRITAVHETIVGLFAGMLVGAALRIGPGEGVQHMLSFSNTIMLNVLLPPIILASGYDLRQEAFFRNFAIILTFAFAGTFISAVVIGVVVYFYSLVSFHTLPLSLIEALIFGSTLSATDPVTILAIFQSYKVDPQLYSVIFGESILNDAVSIVMFDVLSTFRGKPISIASLFHGLGLFFFSFTFSMALGVAFGLACSLMLKHSRLSSFPPLETCLVALIAYTSYFFSIGVGMGGIVSLLFCGVTLKHYAYHNMSRRTQRATKYIFQTLANLSENFIFIYLGLSLFTQNALVYKPIFICVTVAAVVLSRYAAVFPLAALVNAVKRARHRRWARRTGGAGTLRAPASHYHGHDEELPREYQIMLFWAGLRGAVGFALSAGIEGDHAAALQTTVLVAVVLTVIVFGGTTAQMLEILGIRTGVEDDEGDSSDDEERAPRGGDEFGPLVARRAGAVAGSAGRRRRQTPHHGVPLVAPSSTGAGASKRNGGRGDFAAYRDEWPHSAPGALSRGDVVGGGGGGYGGGYGYGYGYADSEVGSNSTSSSNEVLPGTNALGGGGAGGGGGRHGGAAAAAGSDGSLLAGGGGGGGGANENAGELLAADGEDPRSIRSFLDRAGLIMRDGRWFSTLDQRYLTPLFTNPVASRKYEERRAARRSEAAAAAAAAAAAGANGENGHGHGGVGRAGTTSGVWGRRNGSSAALVGGGAAALAATEGVAGERDADQPAEEDEEDEEAGLVLDARRGSGVGVGVGVGVAGGGGGGIRRAPSRHGSDEDLTLGRSRRTAAAGGGGGGGGVGGQEANAGGGARGGGNGGLSGAFAPSASAR